MRLITPKNNSKAEKSDENTMSNYMEKGNQDLEDMNTLKQKKIEIIINNVKK